MKKQLTMIAVAITLAVPAQQAFAFDFLVKALVNVVANNTVYGKKDRAPRKQVEAPAQENQTVEEAPAATSTVATASTELVPIETTASNLPSPTDP